MTSFLTSDGYARIVDGAMLIGDSPCAEACCEDEPPPVGACCPDAPGIGLTFVDGQEAKHQWGSRHIAQTTLIPAQDYNALSGDPCSGLISSSQVVFLAASFNNQVVPDAEREACYIYREGTYEVEAPWQVSTQQGDGFAGTGFVAKLVENFPMVAKLTTVHEFWPAYLWPSGIATPRWRRTHTIRLETTWVAGGGFQSWGGTIVEDTEQPTSLSDLTFANGYTGLQAVASIFVGSGSGCSIPPGAYTTNHTIAGGLYIQNSLTYPGTKLCRFNSTPTGLLQLSVIHPWYGPNPVNSSVRIGANNNECRADGLVYCDSALRTIAQRGGTL